MKTNCIIHIGMAKTGSSSIQETFSQLALPGYHYLSLPSANHSGAIATLFDEEPHKYHGHIKEGRTAKDVEAMRVNLEARMRASLEKASCSTVIISAERLSISDLETVRRFKKFLDEYCDNFQVIGYVRPPVAYMQSVFQQNVKGGDCINMASTYPNYRRLFAKFDRVFGRENVSLIKFDINSLYQGDVVKDFCLHLGIEIPPNLIRRVNEAIGLETVAALFAQRKYGFGYGSYSGASKDNATLIDSLSTLGKQKLRFSTSLVSPVLSDNSDDLKWIEQRLGEPLRDTGGDAEGVIESEDDLLRIAQAQKSKIMELVFENAAQTQEKPETVASCVDMLRFVLIGKNTTMDASKVAQEQTFFTQQQLTALANDMDTPADVLRALALALERSGYQDAARKVVMMALHLRPSGPAIQKIYQRLCEKE